VRHAVKLRIYPTLEQVAFLDRQFGAVRFVWNKALAIKTRRYRVHGDRLSAKHDLKPLLVAAKRSRRYGWLGDFDAISLQQATINLDKAFTNFFKHHARIPRFKRKHGAQSSYHCTCKIAVGEDRRTGERLDALSLRRMNVLPMPEATFSTSFLGGWWTKNKPSASRP
jgi:putative transposase